MRLFRRTLLCLVVSVTAFGAAGWVLRPKPTWSSPLPEGDQYLFVPRINEKADGDPIWLSSIGQEALAFRPTDGALLHSIPRIESGNTDAGFMALPGGRLAVDASNLDERPTLSRFHLFTIPSATPVATTLLRGSDWKLADDGLHAWRKSWEPPVLGFVVESADLSNGGAIRRTEFSDRLKEYNGDLVDYSAAANLVAVSEAMKEEAKSPFGIELHNATTGELVRRIPPCSQGADDDPQSIQFADGGATLQVCLLSSGTVVLDLQRNEVRRNEKPAPSSEATGHSDLDRVVGYGGRCAWVLSHLNPAAAWVYLEESGVKTPTWHRLPFAPKIETWPKTDSGPASRLIGAGCRFVPGRDELVVRTSADAVVTSFPEVFHWCLPAEWSDLKTVERYDWHDWKTGAWRMIGCRGGLGWGQVRRSALLVMALEGNQLVLQSWPLPPPDPKPPALAIAALCMAGTWWVCAWRYRRRMRLAAVGAA